SIPNTNAIVTSFTVACAQNRRAIIDKRGKPYIKLTYADSRRGICLRTLRISGAGLARQVSSSRPSGIRGALLCPGARELQESGQHSAGGGRVGHSLRSRGGPCGSFERRGESSLLLRGALSDRGRGHRSCRPSFRAVEE